MLSSRWPLRSCADDRSSSRLPSTTFHPSNTPFLYLLLIAFPAHLLATFRLLFTLAWATCRRLIRETRRRRSFRAFPFRRICCCFDGHVDRKRKVQLLEALFRASLDEASRPEIKDRPARKAGSASIGNKNKTHKRPSKVGRTAYAR